MYHHATQKHKTAVTMDKGSEKVSIFETVKGPHDMRFVAFNDIPENFNSKFERQPMKVNVEQDIGRDRAPEFPFVNPPVKHDTDHNPNYEYLLKNLGKNHVDMDKRIERKSLVPDPDYDEPHKFYHTIDAYTSPGQDQYKPKQINTPAWEIMNNRRRTDTSYVKMRTTRARDNAMYRITEGWNLDNQQENLMEPQSRQFVCEKFAD